MIHDNPIVIFCSPRGGSSLVAGVFVRHGFWTGPTFGGPDGRGAGGYINYENAMIKEFMKSKFPLSAGEHEDVAPAREPLLRRFCEKIVPDDTAWLFKGPSEYYKPFRLAFPNMTAVMVFRDPYQAVEAHVRRRGEKVRDVAARVVRSRYQFMNETLKKNPLAFRVDAERVVDGDLEQIQNVLDRYGIELNHQLAMDGISPKLFHR